MVSMRLMLIDVGGRPSHGRNWQECFAQLCGTILSVWDATELDLAGDDGEVMPTFINLSDASIKMVSLLCVKVL
jgi:CCR4-NOT transcriptional complex subunit CAF120